MKNCEFGCEPVIINLMLTYDIIFAILTCELDILRFLLYDELLRLGYWGELWFMWTWGAHTIWPRVWVVSCTLLFVYFFYRLCFSISFFFIRITFSIDSFNKLVPRGLISRASDCPIENIHLIPLKALNRALLILELRLFLHVNLHNRNN